MPIHADLSSAAIFSAKTGPPGSWATTEKPSFLIDFQYIGLAKFTEFAAFLRRGSNIRPRFAGNTLAKQCDYRRRSWASDVVNFFLGY